MRPYRKIGIPIAFVHLLGFLITFVSVETSEMEQRQLLYIPFLLIDFPVSILYATPLAEFDSYLKSHGLTWLAYVAYPPLIVSGLLGTTWWYFLPKCFLPRKLGGIWGTRPAE